MSSSDSPVESEAAKHEIAKEIARVHEESYGERASNLTVVLHEEVVSVLMDVDLSPAEKTLLKAGKDEAVRTTREAYQEAIEEVFVAIVERATGRRVIGFASRTVLAEPVPWSVEIFRLGPLES